VGLRTDIAEFGQLTGASYGPLTATDMVAADASVDTLDSCLGMCGSDSSCQWANFDYDSATCALRVAGQHWS